MRARKCALFRTTNVDALIIVIFSLQLGREVVEAVRVAPSEEEEVDLEADIELSFSP